MTKIRQDMVELRTTKINLIYERKTYASDQIP